MFKILDGREELFQWDLNVRLIVEDKTIKTVHFSNGMYREAFVTEVLTQEDGLNVAFIPNILLQDSWDIKAYAFAADHTKVEQVFNVVKKTKPADYVYSESPTLTWENALDRVNQAVTDAEASVGKIDRALIDNKAAIDNALKANTQTINNALNENKETINQALNTNTQTINSALEENKQAIDAEMNKIDTTLTNLMIERDIDRFELERPMKEILKETAPDGTPYNFLKASVLLIIPNPDNGEIIDFAANGKVVASTRIHHQGDGFHSATFAINNGKLVGITTDSDYDEVTEFMYPTNAPAADAITQLEIRSTYGNLPIGTKIEIKGISL